MAGQGSQAGFQASPKPRLIGVGATRIWGHQEGGAYLPGVQLLLLNLPPYFKAPSHPHHSLQFSLALLGQFKRPEVAESPCWCVCGGDTVLASSSVNSLGGLLNVLLPPPKDFTGPRRVP